MILTLDLSSVVGWAFVAEAPIGCLPSYACGSFKLPGNTSNELGRRFAAYENELINMLKTYRPRRVVMEAPLPSKRQGSTCIARQQFGLAAYTEGECYRAGIDCKEASADEVRRAVLGHARFAGGTEQAKAEVLSYVQHAMQCKLSGRVDHNAADAVMILEWMRLRGRMRRAA